jgi:hypothetical protein
MSSLLVCHILISGALVMLNLYIAVILENFGEKAAEEMDVYKGIEDFCKDWLK